MGSADVPVLTNRISSDIPAMRDLFQALLTGQTSVLSSLPTNSIRWVFNGNKTQLTLQYYNGSSWYTIGKLMHDADKLDGYHANTSTTANTIPVRNSSGQIPGDITGKADSATTALNVSGTVSIANGGTGGNTVAEARNNLDVLSSSQIAALIAANSVDIELSSSVTSESTTIAANSKAVKTAYDKGSDGLTAAGVAQSAANTAQATANAARTAADSKMSSFFIKDGDTTAITISNGKYVKFVEGGNIDINFTDTSSGTSSDEYDLTFTVPDASTSIKGAVQLSSSTTSSSTSTAATSSAVNALRALIPSVPNAYITDTWKASNGSSWYLKFSNGLIMQGGILGSSIPLNYTVSLPTRMATTTYVVMVHSRFGASNAFLKQYDDVTNTSFIIGDAAYHLVDKTSSWFVIGF